MPELYMSSSSETKESSPILVEFVREEQSSELQPVGIRDWFKKDKPGLEKKSNAAVDKAMSTIQEMSNRVSSAIDSLQIKPKNVEVEFGIKFDAELDVMVARVGTEASMTVTLKWENEKS
jgi:hypothetical protein